MGQRDTDKGYVETADECKQRCKVPCHHWEQTMGVLGHRPLGHGQMASNKQTKPGSPNGYARGSSKGDCWSPGVQIQPWQHKEFMGMQKWYLECWALNRTPVSPPPSLREHHGREVRKRGRVGRIVKKGGLVTHNGGISPLRPRTRPVNIPPQKRRGTCADPPLSSGALGSRWLLGMEGDFLQWCS